MKSDYPDSPGFKVEGTSQEAAEAIAGRAKTLRDRALAEITKATPRGGLTADAVANKLGESILSIRPRVSELFRAGEIRKSEGSGKNSSGNVGCGLGSITAARSNGSRGTMTEALPAVKSQRAIEEPEEPFDWNPVTNPAIVIPEQRAVAIYTNPVGHIVIREQAAWDDDRDSFVCIAPEHVDAAVDRIMTGKAEAEQTRREAATTK